MSPFLRPRRVEDPLVRMVLLHHAGGSASAYHALGRALPDTWDVLILDLPGRGRRHSEIPLTSMEQIVDMATTSVLGAADDRPLTLFGHSMGAIVASEMTRRLTDRGEPPLWLGVSGRLSPQMMERIPRSRLHLLPDKELLDTIQTLGGLPAVIHEMPGFLRQFLSILRADMTAVGEYRATPGALAPETPMTVYSGTEDPWAPVELLSSWSAHSRGPVPVRTFSGGHFYLQGAHGAERLAERIAADVDKTLRRAQRGQTRATTAVTTHSV